MALFFPDFLILQHYSTSDDSAINPNRFAGNVCFNRLQIEFCGRPAKGIPVELSDGAREHVALMNILVPAKRYRV